MKGQSSFEFMVSLAAFLAFIAVFASVAAAGFERGVGVSKGKIAQESVAEACLYIDFYALDGLHSFSSKSFGGFSSQGKTLSFGNRSRECNSQFRFEGGLLKVEGQVLEVR